MPRSRLPLVLLALGGLSLLGCPSSDDVADADGDATEDSTGDGDPGDGDGDGDPVELSLAADIQPIFDDNCVTSCHQPGGLSSFMDLTDAFNSIVGVPSAQADPVLRVDPGSAADSYIVAKLRGTQADLGGSGARMPAGGAPMLDEPTIAMIEAWIDGGALP